MNPDIARRVRIHGRVQGVWFRAWTVDEATKRGLHGWVRNRDDGSVEAAFRGSEPAVLEMIEACRCGPPNAAVERIEIEEATCPPADGFAQLPTA